MSIQKFNINDDFESFTIETNPRRSYVSSSVNGITGSIHLFAQRSDAIKEVFPLAMFSSSLYTDSNIELYRSTILSTTGTTDKSVALQSYLDEVHNQANEQRKNLTFDVTRYVPGADLDRAHLMKNEINKHLLPFYRVSNPKSHNYISNYNCFNFYSSPLVPTASCFIYPNDKVSSSTGEVTGSWYSLNDKFTFDFFIKPKQQELSGVISDSYNAGTILHLSRSYCISLHSGSSKDVNGKPDRFMLSIGLEGDEQAPSTINPSQTAATRWWSQDNALKANEWHHVCITWPGHSNNEGSGSIYIDTKLNSNFSFNTTALNLGTFDEPNLIQPNALIVGNYWEGNSSSPMEFTKNFFGPDTEIREGLYKLTGTELPMTKSFFKHPLNAEVYNLKIYERYFHPKDVVTSSQEGPSVANDLLRGIKFHLPGFFTEESPYRGDAFGGEFVTPFFTRITSTNTPFAGRMAFGVGGHYINLENYVRDFATGHNPRLWALSASVITDTSAVPMTCNQILYSTGSITKRLYTVLPCDMGSYTPNFGLLSSMSGSKFVNDLGNTDLGHITLNDIVPATMDARSIVVTGSLLDDVIGSSPENITGISSDNLAILNRTRDNSSAQVVMFNISNLFYGKQIKPKSLVIRDSNISGSNGSFGSITLRDDGIGNLYRADAQNDNLRGYATWSSVGNVFYNEGLIIIKYPQLYFFGDREFELEFQGINNIHTFSMNCMASALTQTSSSNPSYQALPASEEILANNDDEKFTWITSVLVHDEDLNVICRVNTAQPIMKRSSDKLLFKVKMDY